MNLAAEVGVAGDHQFRDGRGVVCHSIRLRQGARSTADPVPHPVHPVHDR